MSVKQKYLDELKSIFANASDKREANHQCVQVLSDLSGDSSFLTEILTDHIRKTGSLNTLHYPVVGLEIESNADFTLVANCWIPLPDKSVDTSTKAIHHHGDLLLSTATAFGTGYEHWMFETPSVVDADLEMYELKVLEKSAHPINHVAFVDSYIAHLPFYPPDLTITYALWSSRFKTTWKDKLKRVPVLKNNSARLRGVAGRLGLSKQLDIKVVEYFDFYPTCDGFRGIRERSEFKRGSNEDYLFSLFHVLQETGNDHLSSEIESVVESDHESKNTDLISKLVGKMRSGIQIEGRLSEGHYGIDQMNFKREEILEALSSQASKSR